MKCDRSLLPQTAKGFGYFNPRLPRSDLSPLLESLGVLLHALPERVFAAHGKTGGHMIDRPSDMELAAMASCLAPLGGMSAPSVCSDRWRTTAKTKC